MTETPSSDAQHPAGQNEPKPGVVPAPPVDPRSDETVTSARWGALTDYATGEAIRPATLEEHARSMVAPGGVFATDGRAVYVLGGPNDIDVHDTNN